MTIDNDCPRSRHLFSRMTLDDATKKRLQWSNRQSRKFQDLLVELINLRQHLEGDSIHIDSESKNGLRYAIDEIRALIAIMPAHGEDELRIKCAALTHPTPVVSTNEFLPILAQASILSDICRLKPQRPMPEWLEKWIVI
jgi:hypothetical protein